MFPALTIGPTVCVAPTSKTVRPVEHRHADLAAGRLQSAVPGPELRPVHQRNRSEEIGTDGAQTSISIEAPFNKMENLGVTGELHRSSPCRSGDEPVPAPGYPLDKLVSATD